MSRTPQQIKTEENQFALSLDTLETSGAALAVAKRYSSLAVNFERIGAESHAPSLDSIDQAIERTRGALEALSTLRARLA